MRYDLAIFDFDGTLADTGPWMFGAINRAAARFGFPQKTVEEIEQMRGLPNREIMRALGIQPWKLPRIAMYMRKLAAAEIGQLALFPGIDGMLARLASGGMRLAIVSSNSEQNVRRVMGKAGELIGHYECGASMFGKARRFKRVLQRAGVPAARAIAIGDESRDIDAAKEAEIPAGAVTWGYATADLLRSCHPEEMFQTVDEISQRLLAGSSDGAGLPPYAS
jgi:phosphoglycolate phosphatase